MATGLAVGIANSILNALCRGASWSQPTEVWVQLHIGEPGAAGASNAATETTRKQATFGTNAAGGVIANTAQSQWTAVAATEDYTHFTAWSASTVGTFLFSGLITANAVASNDTFTAAIGAFTCTFTVAS